MLPVASTAGSAAYYALAAFLVLVGVATAFMFLKLGQVFGRVSSLLAGTERDLLPVIVKAGGTVERVNKQLDKADVITDSAVSMADSVDTAVRAVSMAITKPVEKVSGAAAGIAHAVSSFRKNRDFQTAMRDAREAATRREADLHQDLAATERPGPESGTPAGYGPVSD